MDHILAQLFKQARGCLYEFNLEEEKFLEYIQAIFALKDGFV